MSAFAIRRRSHPSGAAQAGASADRFADGAPSRTALFAGLYVVGFINGMAGELAGRPSWQALLGAILSVNLVVLLAGLAGCVAASRMRPERCRPADVFVAVLFALLVLVPSPRISWAALGLLGSFSVIAHRSDRFAVAAGSIFIALSFKQAAAVVLMNLLAEPLTMLDASLVATLLEALRGNINRSANVIENGDGFLLSIMLGCSSVHNISVGGLCWIAITRTVRPRWRSSEIGVGAAIAAVIVILNVARMTLMGFGPSAYAAVHGIGAPVYDFLVLSTALTITLYGVRDELGLGWTRA
jgi:hypothetical protein